jgi:branched-chain amino acid transport system ATP-binding protein
VFPGLTVAEHLLLAGGGGWAGLASTRLSGALRRLTDERATQRADTLSGGERRLLALAMIALREPRVVLLDEPTEGIATTLVPELVATVRSLAERSVLLLVDRQPELIRQTARSAIILERGAVVAHDTIEDLDRRGALRRVLR